MLVYHLCSFLQNRETVCYSLLSLEFTDNHAFMENVSFHSWVSLSCSTEKVGCMLAYCWNTELCFSQALCPLWLSEDAECEHGNSLLLAGQLRWWWARECWQPGFLEDALAFWSRTTVSYLSKPSWTLKTWENSKLVHDACRFDVHRQNQQNSR